MSESRLAGRVAVAADVAIEEDVERYVAAAELESPAG
jgi:hypothetical protein